MSFRNLLRRKSKSKLSGPGDDNNPYGQSSEKTRPVPKDGRDLAPPVPIVKIMRSTTHSQELLTAPTFSPVSTLAVDPKEKAHAPEPNTAMPKRSNTTKSAKGGGGKRLSSLLHLSRRSRAASAADVADMPRGMSDAMPALPKRGDSAEDEAANRKMEEERQSQWEKRATMLVQGTTQPVSIPPSPAPVVAGERKSFDFTPRTGSNTDGQDDDWPLRTPSGSARGGATRSGARSVAGDADGKSMEEKSDDDIQLAIQLHESGDLATSTSMFGRLADPAGANNALAQVLYGLALRHGWGIAPDPNLAIQYLTHSARNASQLTSSLPSNNTTTNNTSSSRTNQPLPPLPTTSIHQTQRNPSSFSSAAAGGAGGSKPALNRGELTLAIYELGNCHRNGWGVSKSPGLAMQYFETAAELGDTDAMLEVAAAWEKGVKGWHGGRKDRGEAARWYRRAERAGRKEVGNSWIWKAKYDLPPLPPAAAAS